VHTNGSTDSSSKSPPNRRLPGAGRGHPELLERLTTGIRALGESGQWQRYLNAQSCFHQYSYRNVLLITAQRPNATLVAGFRAWSGLGRAVRKGEHAIFILAPLRYRRTLPTAHEDDKEIRGFKWVPVFDVAQTEGADLASAVTTLVGDDEAGRYRKLESVAEHLSYTILQAELPEGAHGDCAFGKRQIRLHRSDSAAQQVKSLAHELAHALLHENCSDRPLAELEAESTAYIVCAAMGLDSGDYSFGYVSTWAGGTEEAVTRIEASCERIQFAAAAIMQPYP
jgi:antirestriction protein ArdC